jgi:hypothetical protein
MRKENILHQINFFFTEGYNLLNFLVILHPEKVYKMTMQDKSKYTVLQSILMCKIPFFNQWAGEWNIPD